MQTGMLFSGILHRSVWAVVGVVAILAVIEVMLPLLTEGMEPLIAMAVLTGGIPVTEAMVTGNYKIMFCALFSINPR